VEIIQITEDSPTPGHFTLGLPPSSPSPVTVTADRVVLLNRRVRLEDDEGHRRVRDVAERRRVHYLYE